MYGLSNGNYGIGLWVNGNLIFDSSMAFQVDLFPVSKGDVITMIDYGFYDNNRYDIYGEDKERRPGAYFIPYK